MHGWPLGGDDIVTKLREIGAAMAIKCGQGAIHKGRPQRKGEWGTPKSDIVLEVSRGGSVNLQTRGEGVQKPKIFADVL